MTSLNGINGPSIQTLLREENDSKQSDEFQASATQAMNKEEKSLNAGAEDESKMEENGYSKETKNEIWIWFSRQPRTNFFLMISFVIKSVSVIS